MRLTDLVNDNYQASIKKVRAVWDDLEAKAFADQSAVEKEALRLFSADQDSARSYLTNYSKDLGLQALNMAKEMVHSWDSKRDR